uniref:PPFIA binding protein 2 n=1 Tax=Echeneis naucrates TaxID=173247 RepID=A0A665THF8_ECHNA
METEASHMLEAALEQMDDIIAGSKVAAVEFSNSMYDLGSPINAGPLQVVQLAEDLKLALELRPNQEERDSLRAQLQTETAQALIDWLQSGTVTNNETYQERLLRLEGDKESLVLQVSVLTDQVEAQGEKIRDLESSLEEHRQKLASTEEMLKQELISRTSLETQKLDLMDEVSYLKLKIVSMEETHTDTQPQDPAETKQNKAEDLLQEVKQLKSKVDELEGEKSQYERKLRATKVEDLIQTSQSQARGRFPNNKIESDKCLCPDEQDRRIEELTILLSQYRKMREVMALTSEEELTSSFKLRAITHKAHSDILRSEVSSKITSPFLQPQICASPHMELSKYQTLPGKMSKKSELKVELNGDGEYLSPVQLSPVHSHDQGPPEKLEENVLSDQSPLSSGVDSGQQSPVSPENRKTHRGIKKLWGKIRRSQSGSPVQVHDPELGEFKRGGFRATAGPRLARPGNTRDLKMPFSKWSTEQVCDWLEDVGLSQYSVLARQWVTSGQTLLSATVQDLEKEVGIKNPLHRKKLQLAIKTFSSKQPEKSAELDYIWVTRWLDDIGLPQYKDQFNEGRVDGHMLQYLTVNDLLFLKVTSQLHHLSIKCAIHVLHVNRFNSNCLKRRPSNESQFTPSEVVQWSNHRVMEWLRSVDLAEYAPNLRGSGVHGGLIMLEPRFNSDTLAMLLNIPPQKTLLRRHLTTNFNSLVGAQAQQEKREYTEAASYTPLSITAKVKPKKLGFSNLTHLRRRRPDESTDYVCPIESSSPQSGKSVVNGVQMRPYAGFRGLSPILDREPDRSRDQVGNKNNAP